MLCEMNVNQKKWWYQTEEKNFYKIAEIVVRNCEVLVCKENERKIRKTMQIW